MKNVLVVDDNILMRRLIINLFQEDNMSFDEAGDGEEGLSKIDQNNYDLVITDIVMPKIEGLEMIMQIKRKKPDLKIIAISGCKPYYLYMAKKLGIDAVFTKPLNHQSFYTAVSTILKFHPSKITRAS